MFKLLLQFLTSSSVSESGLDGCMQVCVNSCVIWGRDGIVLRSRRMLWTYFSVWVLYSSDGGSGDDVALDILLFPESRRTSEI